MSDIKIIEETAVPMYVVKEEISKVKERDGELNYRSEKTEEYINQNVKLESSDYEHIKKEIMALNLVRLKDETLIKILDLLPTTEDEVKLIFSANDITLKKEDAVKVAEVVKGVLS